MLAPIENMTDSCFRSICHGADMTFTEMTSLEALAKGDPFAWERIKLYDDTPCTIQLIGHKEDSLRSFLSEYKPEKGFRGFNLNLGCPDPEAVRSGHGAAMIKRISKVKKLIDMIKSFGYEASIKMRPGLNQFEKDRKVYLNLINNVGADYFIMHARHAKETYADKADWTVIAEMRKNRKEYNRKRRHKNKRRRREVQRLQGSDDRKGSGIRPASIFEIEGIGRSADRKYQGGV